MCNQPNTNNKEMCISKISYSKEAKDKKFPRPTFKKNSKRPKCHSSFRSNSEKFIFVFSNENIVNDINKDLNNGTLSNKNFINVNDSSFPKAKSENQNKNNSFVQGDIPNSDKNNGFSPNISHQSKDLINDSNNNTQLGQQILGKLDEIINKSSEVNETMKKVAEEMKNATVEMKESNANQNEMLALLAQLVKRFPEPKSGDGKNNI